MVTKTHSQTELCKMQFKTNEDRIADIENIIKTKVDKDFLTFLISIVSASLVLIFGFITWTYQQQLNQADFIEMKAEQRHEEILKILGPVKEDVAVLKSKVK